MKIRHKPCDATRCSDCIHNASLLEERLTKETMKNNDHLGLYYGWLASNNIPNETKGWVSLESYKEENINNYIKWFKEEYTG